MQRTTTERSPRRGRILTLMSISTLGLAVAWSASQETGTCRAADSPVPAGLPFRVPPGFVAERVAGPGLVEHPMFACFDDRGRLLVADSAGSNPSGEALAKEPPHRIRRLEDADGDGRFD